MPLEAHRHGLLTVPSKAPSGRPTMLQALTGLKSGIMSPALYDHHHDKASNEYPRKYKG